MAKTELHTVEEVLFDANLQEFATRVGTICALESGRKLTPAEAYEKVRALWKQLKSSKKNLLGKSLE